MYDYLDRDLASLGPGARFAVWAMRGWVMAMQRRQCPCNVLAPGFTRWGLSSALPHFSMAMAVLNGDARETLVFRAPCHPHVGEHEALLLGLIAASGVRPELEVRETLALIVHPPAVPALVIALERLGHDLDGRGLRPAPSQNIGTRL